MHMSDAQQVVLKRWSDYHLENGGLPSRKHFSLKDLGRHVTNIVIVDVKDDPLDFEYRLVGTSVAEYMHQDYTGSRLSSIPGKGRDSKFWACLKNAYEEGTPRFFHVPYIGPRQVQDSVYTLYLPLATDHHTIDKLLLVPHYDTKTAIIPVGLQTLH